MRAKKAGACVYVCVCVGGVGGRGEYIYTITKRVTKKLNSRMRC